MRRAPPAGRRRTVLAVDLGGTKTACALVRATGEVLAQTREPAEKGRVDATATQVARMARALLEAAGLRWDDLAAAGVIVPGIHDVRTGRAWAPNLWGTRDVPLAAALKRRVPLPLRVDSDRTGYVLGESWLGAARDRRDVVFLAVGTGIGAGILSGGRVLRGARGIAGAVGWFALSERVGREHEAVGSWEAEAAGPALARKGGRPTAQEVLAAASAGDPAALAAVADVAGFLARGVANLISAFDPEMVVLGGGVMSAGRLFLPRIREEVRAWAQPVAARRTRIVLSRLGERAGLLGAARLALAQEEV